MTRRPSATTALNLVLWPGDHDQRQRGQAYNQRRAPLPVVVLRFPFSAGGAAGSGWVLPVLVGLQPRRELLPVKDGLD
jgi:hypothetical protein